MTGEWFLDTSEGTPYATQILENNTENVYDLAIQDRILNTQGVAAIISYQSTKNSQRALTVQSSVDTIYSSDYNSTINISTNIGG